METWGGLADEGGDGGDAFVLKYKMLQRVADAAGGFEAAAFGQSDLHGEAVAFGIGHHLHVEG